MSNKKVKMPPKEKEITWQRVNNTVAKRMMDLSMAHKLVAKRILRKRTRILNSMMERMPVRTYSQYVKMKTSALRNFPNDCDIDDEDKLTDEDYMQVYNSEESMINYLSKSSTTIVDLAIDSDDDFICLSQSNSSGKQDDSLGWHRVIKKKVRVKKEPAKDLQEQSTEKTKRTVPKTIDKRKKSVSVKSSIKELFMAKQLDNDNGVLENGDNTETDNISDIKDPLDDAPLNERQIVPITKSPEQSIRVNNQPVESTINNSSPNIEPQNDSINNDISKKIKEDNSLSEKESIKSTPDKDLHRKRKKSDCQEEKNLSIKKKEKKFATKETVEDTKENVKENIPKVNEKEVVVTVKKNLMGAFENFSIISGHQVPEFGESSQNESTDMNRTNLRMSNINPLCRSTPVPCETPASRFLQPVSEKQKDSGIDDDSQEESSESGKAKVKTHIIVPPVGNQINGNLDSSNNDSDLSDEPPMVIDEDACNNDASMEDTDSEDTLVLSNCNATEGDEDSQKTVINNPDAHVEEKQQNQKPQPKVTCSEILSKKFKIITAKPQEEPKESTPPAEETCEDPQENKDDDNESEISVDDEHEDHQSQITIDDEHEDHQSQIAIDVEHEDHQTQIPITETQNIEEDSDNPDEMMSMTSTKRVQQLKRLDLTAVSSSSEDEDDTIYKTQKPPQILAINHDTDDDSNDDASCIADSQNLKKTDEPKIALKKKNKGSLQEDLNLTNISFVPDSQDSQKLDKSKASTKKKQKQEKLQLQARGSKNNVENEPDLVQGEKNAISTTKWVEESENESECASSLAEDFPLAQKMNESVVEPIEVQKVNEPSEKQTTTRIEVSLGEAQTDIHIPPRAILRRPNDLQDYIGQETLVKNELLTSFSLQDFADDEVYIINIPKKLINSKLIGQKIVLTKNKLKLGKHKYKALHKKVKPMTCVLRSGDTDKSYKAVNVKPVGAVITQARLNNDAGLPSKPPPEIVQPSTSKNLQLGNLCKIKPLNKKYTKEHFIKGPKRKLSEIQSSKVSEKKEKKRRKMVLYDDDGSSS